MGNDLMLRIVSKNTSVYYDQIVRNNAIDLSVFDVQIIDRVFIKNLFIQAVYEEGLSSILLSQPINEQVIKKNEEQGSIIHILKQFLDKIIEEKDEFIIVDPYFLKCKKCKIKEYVKLVCDVFRDYIPRLSSMVIVTHPEKYDLEMKEELIGALKKINERLVTHHITNDDFHDRFWISSHRKKGLFVGTSLNSVGKRYALIDYLKNDDLKEIVAALPAINL